MSPLSDEIAYAKIHPAIGIARVGNSEEFFYGPEVPDAPAAQPGFYKDANGAIKRQAARFRVYGYNADGKVVGEITPASDLDPGFDSGPHGTITWHVEVANKKAAWYQFHLALDTPDGQRLYDYQYGRRNQKYTGDRKQLEIRPGKKTIKKGDGPQKFLGKINNLPEDVYLGELRIDDGPDNALLVLGGKGKSAAFKTGEPLTTFANNDWWYDDTSDGPVRADVVIGGKNIPVEPAWVVVGPPNYAPDVKSIRTLYDCLYDLFAGNGWGLAPPQQISYADHIEPILRRFTEHQWVNHGFATQFGWKGAYDFTEDRLRKELSSPKPQHREQRRQVYESMRDYARDGVSPMPWPWLYGDGMAVPPRSEYQNLMLSPAQFDMLAKWAEGHFVTESLTQHYEKLSDVPLKEQPAILDRAALDYCLADAFHPGCEVTWPIRHDTMYSEPFRIKHRTEREPDYGDRLTPGKALSARGPLGPQGPGDLTRWMAVPWQTDTASCRSGYELAAKVGPRYSPYLPAFWPASVPNQVLTEEDFNKVNAAGGDDERETAFERRAVWLRFLSKEKPKGINEMIQKWHKLGIVEVRDYVVGDGKFPKKIQVESKPDLPPAPYYQNLINVHVPEAGGTPRSSDGEIVSDAVDRVAEQLGVDEDHISAGYIEKVDPFHEAR
ncbi:LodA/GoxA family CTQ-dependent oxidase [Streptomyces sp. HNM0574]|uniref:LodA/GoxA family CTQ-dependent oxidase n=1 Tax=Streptomyces sp. HNM0574 TaxID=2714954 RepID=UPI00146BF605|nr:LodA/GoxA family CTQ-dependent oxidase [Streptomyces sp. HNM0574]NLU67006.1 hypothetical protein [Streptomyces sp. HNM0574]